MHSILFGCKMWTDLCSKTNKQNFVELAYFSSLFFLLHWLNTLSYSSWIIRIFSFDFWCFLLESEWNTKKKNKKDFGSESMRQKIVKIRIEFSSIFFSLSLSSHSRCRLQLRLVSECVFFFHFVWMKNYNVLRHNKKFMKIVK